MPDRGDDIRRRGIFHLREQDPRLLRPDGVDLAREFALLTIEFAGVELNCSRGIRRVEMNVMEVGLGRFLAEGKHTERDQWC